MRGTHGTRHTAYGIHISHHLNSGFCWGCLQNLENVPRGEKHLRYLFVHDSPAAVAEAVVIWFTPADILKSYRSYLSARRLYHIESRPRTKWLDVGEEKHCQHGWQMGMPTSRRRFQPYRMHKQRDSSVMHENHTQLTIHHGMHQIWDTSKLQATIGNSIAQDHRSQVGKCFRCNRISETQHLIMDRVVTVQPPHRVLRREQRGATICH